MIKKVKLFLLSIGIIPIKQHPIPFNYNYKDYDLTKNSNKIIQHKDFLKSVLEEENNRLGYIESKTSQIISQTSIVFSVVGLFVPIVIDRFENAPLLFKITIIILLLLAFSLYLLSITNALKNFNVKKFQYPYSNPANVLNLKDKSIKEFNSELVRDYLICINRSIQINNEKATNLLHGYKAFKLGNYFTGIIVICICSMWLLTKTKDSTINIENPIRIKNLDSILKSNKQTIIIPTLKDTIIKEKTKMKIQPTKIK